jgi:hypothetical protein
MLAFLVIHSGALVIFAFLVKNCTFFTWFFGFALVLLNMQENFQVFGFLMQFLVIWVFYKMIGFVRNFETFLRGVNLITAQIGMFFYLQEKDFFKVFFKILNFEVLFLSWMLIRELSSFSEDIKNDKKTLARALGRYESYKMFTLLQILFYSLVLLDCISEDRRKAVVLMLIPWTCYFVFLIRNMKMETFSFNYLCFAIISSSLLVAFP